MTGGWRRERELLETALREAGEKGKKSKFPTMSWYIYDWKVLG